MKKIIRSLFIIFCGLAVGGAVGSFFTQGSETVLKNVSASVSEIDNPFLKSEKQEGAEELSDFQKLLVFENTDQEKKYLISNLAPVPNVSANSYLVGDIETGEIILSRNSEDFYPIASITKLMTALMADEDLGLNEIVKISQRAIATYGKQGRLAPGEVYTVSEILYPLILTSSNDAAEAIAETKDRTVFIDNMNDKAKSIGMNNTYFADASGLSYRNVSSAQDLFKLAQYIENYREYLFDISRTKKYDLGNKSWYNNSKFRSDDDYYGGKNGYTNEAGHTQVAIFNMKISGENKKIAFITLNTDNIEANIYGLKRYVERHVSFE